MRRTMLACAVMVALGFCAVSVAKAKATVDSHPATDTHEEWKLGVQAYSFRKYTFFEAVDKAAALGLDWIEAYPGQKVGGPFPKVTFRPNTPEKVRKAVKKKLDEAGVRLVNYGVVGLPNNEKKCRQVFEFARDMGVETIVSEPPAKALKMIDKLCRKYKINVAIHNHPKPSPYWNPDKILEATKGLSKRIGACADPGHWERSGIDPVQSLQKLVGRIVSLHLKDVENGHGIMWNTGNRDDINRVLTELRRQDFEGVISIEY